MRDINEYTGMTRDEFLKGIKINELGAIYAFHGMDKHNEIQYGLGCPNAFGLKSTDCTVNCKECWKQAVKDIKFKEENMGGKDYKEMWKILRESVNDGIDIIEGKLVINNQDKILKKTVSKSMRTIIEEMNELEQRSEVDWSKVEKDDKMQASVNGIDWVNCYFAVTQNGEICYWIDGRTSFTTSKYTSSKFARLYKED